MPIAAGETFERYSIETLIGRGGMGEVYRATDTRLRRKVALKVLRRFPSPLAPLDPRERPDAVARLFREARAAAALSHPNTIAIHDLGEAEDGTFYIVMELVTGAPLLAYVGDDRVSLARKMGWLVDIARALAAAHKAGVLHRDVKPSNVMIGEDDVVKVLDFGLAKPVMVEPVSFSTAVGRVVGTPRYMAPELMTGTEADARSDQYAFGVTAYELISGVHPLGAVGIDAPKPLAVLVPEIPGALAGAIARTMAKEPRDRFESMEDVALALTDLRAGRPIRITVPRVAAATIRESNASLGGAETLRQNVSPLAVSGAAVVAAISETDETASLPLLPGSELDAPPSWVDRQEARARAHHAARTLLSREAPSELRRAVAKKPDAPFAKTVASASDEADAARGQAIAKTTLKSAPPAATTAMMAPLPLPPPAPLGVAAVASSPPYGSNPPQQVSVPARSSAMGVTIAFALLTILVLGGAVFAGTYYASRPPPAPMITATPASSLPSSTVATPPESAPPAATEVPPLPSTTSKPAILPPAKLSAAPMPTPTPTPRPTAPPKPTATHTLSGDLR